MPEVRRLPSGKWKATIYTPIVGPSGRRRRRSHTHALKRVVVDWAREQEGAVSSGAWTDARHADLTLRDFRAEWVLSRISVKGTSKKNESQWRNHIEPVWAGHPLSAISRPDIKTWVHRMHTLQCPRCRAYPGLTSTGRLSKHKNSAGRACGGSGGTPGLGAWTIQGAVAHLSGLLSAAVEDGRLAANPAFRLNLPTAAPKPIFFWTHDEADQILLELGGTDALAVDLDMHVGFRPGELFGLRRQYVDASSWLIHVYGVATRDGWRPHAKTTMSHRAAPVPGHLRDRLWARIADLKPDDLVFPSPEGDTWNDRNFAQRVFGPAVKRAGVRVGTPYDMRHTAASWLVQDGVPLLDVQRLLGHEKYSTTLRYAHLAPGEYSNILEAWEGRRMDPRAARVPLAAHEVPDGPGLK